MNLLHTTPRIRLVSSTNLNTTLAYLVKAGDHKVIPRNSRAKVSAQVDVTAYNLENGTSHMDNGSKYQDYDRSKCVALSFGLIFSDVRALAHFPHTTSRIRLVSRTNLNTTCAYIVNVGRHKLISRDSYANVNTTAQNSKHNISLIEMGPQPEAKDPGSSYNSLIVSRPSSQQNSRGSTQIIGSFPEGISHALRLKMSRRRRNHRGRKRRSRTEKIKKVKYGRQKTNSAPKLQASPEIVSSIMPSAASDTIPVENPKMMKLGRRKTNSAPKLQPSPEIVSSIMPSAASDTIPVENPKMMKLGRRKRTSAPNLQSQQGIADSVSTSSGTISLRNQKLMKRDRRKKNSTRKLQPPPGIVDPIMPSTAPDIIPLKSMRVGPQSSLHRQNNLAMVTSADRHLDSAQIVPKMRTSRGTERHKSTTSNKLEQDEEIMYIKI